MLLDLWNKDELIHKFIELYNLNAFQMCNILKRIYFNDDFDYISVFCEETGIRLDKVNVASNIEIFGKIISTTVDNFNHLKEVGLLPIDLLLKTKSPISNFLEKHKIEIKPHIQKLSYNGKHCFIPKKDEECLWCAYGDDNCRYNQQRYKEMYCSYLQAIKPLSTKLYSDNSEIEMFLFASEKQMLKYSTVKNYPEIFLTIENFINDFFDERLMIGDEWKSNKQHTYIVSFPVRFDDMSYRSNYICAKDVADAECLFLDYSKFCEDAYYSLDEVPKSFWDNIWIINTCLEAIKSSSNASCIYAGIKHNIAIPYNQLKIDLI